MEKEIGSQRKILKVNLIGQVLLKKGYIASAQLEEGLDIQKREGGFLGEVLIKKGFVSEELFTAALVNQLDVAYLPVESYTISKNVLNLIPKDLAYKYCFIPLERIGDVLTVAIANPLDLKAIEQIEIITTCKIVCLLGKRTEIEECLNKYYQN